MYKRHTIMSFLLIIIALICSLIFDLRFSNIADVAITVISIALAMYIAVATALLGSPYSKFLRREKDKENPNKSMLKRLASYLKIAGTYSIITIMISTIYILKPDTDFLQKIIGKYYYMVLRICSAISCALYICDCYLMFLILNLLIVTLLNAALKNEQ